MRLEAKKYLLDIQHAADLLTQFTAGRQFADYETDAMLRAAVERKFEIIGEALAQSEGSWVWRVNGRPCGSARLPTF